MAMTLQNISENFFVKLGNPKNAALSVAEAEGTIINDDYLPLLIAGGTQLTFESCQPANQAIDPLEVVTVNFGLQNKGLGPTTESCGRLACLQPDSAGE